MKKLMLLLSLVLSLVACSPKSTQLTASEDLFKDKTYLAVSDDSQVRQIQFKGNQMIVSVDFNKKKNKLFVNKFYSNTYYLGASLPTADSLSKEVRLFEAGMAGYDASYGERYFIFYNFEVVEPTQGRDGWGILMDWQQNAKDDPEIVGVSQNHKRDYVFNFTIKDNLLYADDYTYKLK